jgi:hypothetical protein
MLLNRIKRVMSLDISTLDTNMQVVHDPYCIDVEDLSLEENEDNSNFQMSEQRTQIHLERVI